MELEYRPLSPEELGRALFAGFDRHQEVRQCWRKIDGAWCVRDIAFTEDWSPEDYDFLAACLRNTLRTGGLVAAAFAQGELKGFVSVESAPMGSRGQYRDLSSIHVSADLRGQGVGRELFALAKHWGKAHGAEKLYISAHSSVESQAFYRRMGCVEAAEYDPMHVHREPCDCQLECPL